MGEQNLRLNFGAGYTMQWFCNLHETVLCFTKQFHTQYKLVGNRKMSFLYLVYDKNITQISGIF